MPLAPHHTIGRIYATDWTVAHVAKLLKFNAARGMIRAARTTGSDYALQQDYLRTCSARHLPSRTIVTFTREQQDNCWHAALASADINDYLPWDRATAEEWLAALFGDDLSRVYESPGPITDPARHFRLPA